MATTWVSGTMSLDSKARVLRALEESTSPEGETLANLVIRVGVSKRVLTDHLRRLRGEGKVERIHLSEHVITYRRKRRP